MDMQSLIVLKDSYYRAVGAIKNKFGVDISEQESPKNGTLLPDISERVSRRFVGTKVEVYTIDIKEPNAFAIPFRDITTRPFFQGLEKIFLIGPLFSVIFGALEGAIRSNLHLIAHGNEPVKFDPKTRTANIHIPKVKCFVSNELLSLLKDDEIDAVIMHEVGHNAPVMQMAFLYSLETSAYGGWFISLIQNPKSNVIFPFFMFLFMLISILNYYYGKKFEIYADTFAVNMGYAKPLISALFKMRKWNDAYIDKFVEEQKFTKEQEDKFRKTIEELRKNDVHMQDEDRKKFLQKKNNEYLDLVKRREPILQNSYAAV